MLKRDTRRKFARNIEGLIKVCERTKERINRPIDEMVSNYRLVIEEINTGEPNDKVIKALLDRNEFLADRRLARMMKKLK